MNVIVSNASDKPIYEQIYSQFVKHMQRRIYKFLYIKRNASEKGVPSYRKAASFDALSHSNKRDIVHIDRTGIRSARPKAQLYHPAERQPFGIGYGELIIAPSLHDMTVYRYVHIRCR